MFRTSKRDINGVFIISIHSRTIMARIHVYSEIKMFFFLQYLYNEFLIYFLTRKKLIDYLLDI
jgi:hypothetical protein